MTDAPRSIDAVIASGFEAVCVLSVALLEAVFLVELLVLAVALVVAAFSAEAFATFFAVVAGGVAFFFCFPAAVRFLAVVVGCSLRFARFFDDRAGSFRPAFPVDFFLAVLVFFAIAYSALLRHAKRTADFR